jgi:hypothetical protein
MSQISYCYFIKIILEIIQELNLDTNKSCILLYIYSLIVYNIFSTYYLKFENSIKNPIKYRHNWLKTFLYTDTFYVDFMIQINLNLLFMLNNYLNSEILKKYFEKNFAFIYSDSNYINFISQNQNIINEIKYNIQIHLDLIFPSGQKNFFVEKKINIIETDNNPIMDTIFSNNFYQKIINKCNEDYNKMNKTKELIEILSLCNNVSKEQEIINVFLARIINKIGITGLFNLIICSYYSKINKSHTEQVKSFYLLNIYLYNGLVLSTKLNEIYKETKPYHILKQNVLESNEKNSVWFIRNEIKIIDSELYDFPSKINIMSILGLNFIKKIIGNNTKNVKFNQKEINLLLNETKPYTSEVTFEGFPIFLNYNVSNSNSNSNSNYKNNSNTNLIDNNLIFLLDFKEWSSLFESIMLTNLNLLQSYITSFQVGKDIGIDVSKFIDNILLKNLDI